eukprot:368718_1
MYCAQPPEIISGSDVSNPASPILFKQQTTFASIQRVPTLSELKIQYNQDITKHASLDINTLQHQLSEISTPDLLASDENVSEMNKKLERTWTLMLSHFSRMETHSQAYIEQERDLPNDNNDKSSSHSSTLKLSPRKSFFNKTGLSIASERSVLNEQSFRIRLMNNKYVRWLYHFGSRLSSACDQITDLILLISLIIAGETAHSIKYLCFILAPYVVLSLLLISPLTRRSEFVASMLYENNNNNSELSDDLITEQQN